MKIYISPSNQPRNVYKTGNTNEKTQMEAIAKLLVKELKVYNVTVKLATLSKVATARDEEAKAFGADLYFAIHSNAGDGEANGVVAFYHKNYPLTKTLSENIVKELNAICPYKEDRANQVVDGMTPFNKAGIGEIREPAKKGISSCLVEVDFHDNSDTSKWIIDSKPEISKALLKSLVRTYGLNKKTDKVVEKMVYFEKGDKGESVKKIQQGLMKLGYDLSPYGADGSFGEGTRKVVMKFQKDQGLKVDGFAGTATMTRLESLINKQNAIGYSVQVGYFEKKQNAEDMVDKLAQLGFKSIIKVQK